MKLSSPQIKALQRINRFTQLHHTHIPKSTLRALFNRKLIQPTKPIALHPWFFVSLTDIGKQAIEDNE